MNGSHLWTTGVWEWVMRHNITLLLLFTYEHTTSRTPAKDLLYTSQRDNQTTSRTPSIFGGLFLALVIGPHHTSSLLRSYHLSIDISGTFPSDIGWGTSKSSMQIWPPKTDNRVRKRVAEPGSATQSAQTYLSCRSHWWHAFQFYWFVFNACWLVDKPCVMPV